MIDEDIKELIELLSTFDKLCVYHSGRGRSWDIADIYLYYGDDSINYSSWKSYLALAVFAKRLAAAISTVLEEEGGDKSPLYYLDMSIKWRSDKEFPIFLMEMPVDSLAEITKLFYKVKKELDDSMKYKRDIDHSELITELSRIYFFNLLHDM